MSYNYGSNEAFEQLIAIVKRELNTKEDVFIYSTMPTASASTVGKYVFYTGTTTADYTNGDIYVGIATGEDPDPVTYSWSKVTYNKSEVDSLIAAAGHFIAVEQLPTTDIKTNVIYLVPKTPIVGKIYGYQTEGSATADVYVLNGSVYDKYEYDSTDSIFKFAESVATTSVDISGMVLVTVNAELKDLDNIKDEYINLDGTTAGWELIGSTAMDLSNYVQKDEMIPITAAQITALWNSTSPAV